MNSRERAPRSRWLRVYSGIMAIVALPLVYMGGKLVFLGGSPYYFIAGILVAISAVMLWRRTWLGGIVYGALMMGTLVWGLWEVGLDGWALVPRLVAPAMLGFPLLIWLLVWISRKGRGSAIAASAALASFTILCVYVAFGSFEDLEPQRFAALAGASDPDPDWRAVGMDAAGARFSPLAQINASNVATLRPAWSTYLDQKANGLTKIKFQGTPIKIGDNIYMCTGANDVIALDPDSGSIKWRFNAKVRPEGVSSATCRGVTYHRITGATGVCSERIYTATVDARLLAIDARSGVACPTFGAGGQVDLGLGMDYRYPGYYSVSSAPQMIRGKLVVGGQVTDNQSVGEPSGVIRAYDAVTGELAWAWDMGNPELTGEPEAGQLYTPGTPNSWGPMSADEVLGLVYVPLGNATPDYVAAHRAPYTEKYSSSLVAIDAETGKPRWHFQTTHRDVWDYDVGHTPTLVDLPRPGGIVPAVVQVTKPGEIFVLDRRTGKPVFPVEERPVPQGTVPEERLSPTQPFSTLPSAAGAMLTERDMWGATPIDQLWCRIKFREARYEGVYTPITLEPTITYPGSLGGMEWPAGTFDPNSGMLVYISNHFAYYTRLLPRTEADRLNIEPTKDGRYGAMLFRQSSQEGTPYASWVHPFLSPIGMPCQQPPFGKLNALDLKTGKLAWSRPLGTARNLGPMGTASGLPIPIGTMTVGGAITTAGGLTFTGASFDSTARAFETASGRLLWKASVPGNILATPMTYAGKEGKQYVVFAVGDGPAVGGSPYGAGGTLIAYSIP